MLNLYAQYLNVDSTYLELNNSYNIFDTEISYCVAYKQFSVLISS
jgi:hypothetical protein